MGSWVVDTEKRDGFYATGPWVQPILATALWLRIH